MGLASLNAAISGLKVYQQQISTISANIANVGTDGYTRKILPQSSQVIEGSTAGVVGETIVRNISLSLQSNLWTQVSTTFFFDVQQNYLERIEQFHGDPASKVSIASEVEELLDAFIGLSDTPEDRFLLSGAVNQAQNMVNKINEFSTYIRTLRNDAQSEIESTVQAANGLLEQIADLNNEVARASISGSETASIEDKRDNAIKELSSYLQITTFKRGDNVVVVQTFQGAELASTIPTALSFDGSPLSDLSTYPDSAAGIYVGDPVTNPSAFDITENLGEGKLGGLIRLRDVTFPKQTAQLDELAHKMALRFDAQGLKLFTDSTGTIPLDTPPDISVDPPTPVPYVGFASQIRVNTDIVNDPTLLQRGTYDATLPQGSNEVIRRVIEFSFGSIDYQLAANDTTATSVDIRANATGTTTLQDWLGLRSTNTVSSGISLSNYASISAMVTAGGGAVFGSGAGETDRFVIRFDDPDIGSGPYDVSIDLRAVAVSGSGAAQDLVNHITADANWANIVTDFGASVSVGVNGELVINSSGDIEIRSAPAQNISVVGMEFLGLSFGLSEATDPYFDIQVGNNDAVRVSIEPADTETQLLNKLNAIDGVVAQLSAGGFLSIRPGNSFTNPDFGGDIKLTSGPFVTDNAALAGTASGRISIDDGVNILSALFGTYANLGGGVFEDQSPIQNIEYQSETYQGSGEYVQFRSEYLGPGGSIDSKISSASTIGDFSQKMINEQSLELDLIKARHEDQTSLQNLLEQETINSFGVNIDQELGFLITVQTAYAAAARVIGAVNDLFDDLLNAI